LEVAAKPGHLRSDKETIMPHDLLKTLTYLSIHLAIGFSVAFWFTGSVGKAGSIALIEPCINAVAFFFHEKAWRGQGAQWLPRLLARSGDRRFAVWARGRASAGHALTP
jgi:uncharacterized membrane protein